MKKYLAFVLACAILLPLLSGCAVFAAETTSKEYTAEPFLAAGGTFTHGGRFANMYDYYMVTFQFEEDQIFFGGKTPEKLEAAAEKMKAYMDNLPEGIRLLRPHYTHKALGLDPEAVIYLDKGVDKAKAAVTAFLEKYHSIGGKLSVMNVDSEYVGLSSYYISQALEKDPLLFNKIVTHPNYATEVRPLLEERGFQFCSNDSPYTTEIWAVFDKSGEEYAQSRAIWDRVMAIRLRKYINEIFYEPLMQYYPDAVMFDYQCTDTYAWHKELNGYGEVVHIGGNAMKGGNASYLNSYAFAPSDTFYVNTKKEPVYKKPFAYNNAIYADLPFKMFLWDANRFKNMYVATDTKKITACLAEYDYNTERKGSSSNTPYYTETFYHIGMLNPEPFLLYVYHKRFDTEDAYFYRLQVIEEILNELTRVAGYSDRKPIVLPTNWNNSFVISGMYAGGRNIWRITPDTTNGVTKETFRIEAADPTFYIDGQTVTFPGGRIIEDSAISVVGTCGYWVETDADVVPVIQNEADRYEKYPAYFDSFENYKPGTVINYSTALPAKTWEVTDKSKQSVVAVEDKNAPGNQVLAVTGTASLQNFQLPPNITAADSYAKRQVWELTVTLPEVMPAEGAVILLRSDNDGGFKITADKVCYDQNGEYVEMTGVKLTPGGKYTVKRVLDFTGAEAFSSCYYLYDAEGKQVGCAENVEMKKFNLPVQKIGFGCENLGANTAYFDDYKLYAVGFAADFELYGAKLGMQITDITAAQTGEIAYRYSWMNASDKTETVQIVAQTLDGEGNVTSETIIQELTMLPGWDGVETGIYDAGETATVLAVKPVEEAKGSGLLLYIAIAAAVVLAASAAAVIVVAKKKK